MINKIVAILVFADHKVPRIDRYLLYSIETLPNN
jgi:hypothetical protein